jgi:hypothetical protein
VPTDYTDEELRETIQGIVREELNEETLRNIMAEVVGEETIRNIVRSELAAVGETMSAELVEDVGFIEEARKVAREEIRSLAGLGLRRTQERDYTRSPDRNAAIDIVNEDQASFWGEVLNDFRDELTGPAPS